MASVVHVVDDTEITRNSLGEWTLRHVDGLSTKCVTVDAAIRRLVDSFGLSSESATKAVKKILKSSR
jgi:hypothetical protein